MTTIKSYTDLKQSEILSKILKHESADMYYPSEVVSPKFGVALSISNNIPCWSLAALLEELNRNCWKVSLKCYGAEWDMTYDDGERYISVSEDNPIDACYEMVLKLHELKML